MINYWADIIVTNTNDHPSYWPVIYANGDILYEFDVGFPEESHENLAANFYIKGFEHARGES